jgi:hypothetical protein
MSNEKYTIGFGLSLAITSIITSILVIIKELYEPLMNAMKSLGHHWVIHGIFTLLLFIILGFILSKDSIAKKYDAIKTGKLVLISTLLGSLMILVFFLIK